MVFYNVDVIVMIKKKCSYKSYMRNKNMIYVQHHRKGVLRKHSSVVRMKYRIHEYCSTYYIIAYFQYLLKLMVFVEHDMARCFIFTLRMSSETTI